MFFTPCPSVSIVNFEHVIAGWESLKSNHSDVIVMENSKNSHGNIQGGDLS